ncbi:MAG: DEAD/DEAH box helicase, partial [Micrococcales bacterium]|nr:DEAD/DEAH box helicase [Micrococcales bacterium]
APPAPAPPPRPARARHDRPARTERPALSRDERPAFPHAGAPRHSDRLHRDTPRSDAAPRHEPVEDVVLERLEGEVDSADTEGVSFGDLGLGPNIVRVLAELGAAAPFPIQAATIPDALAGRDVLGRGRTGSGKTIAFAAPLVERILRGRADRAAGERRKPGRAPEALILAPTRELALQIDRTVQPIAQSVGLFTTQVYGGVPYARQYGALSRGVDIVIGTPGRVEDLIEQGRLDLSRVSIVVLDEADHMTDLGFLEPVQRILRRTADDGQRMMFSATLDTAVAALVDEFLADPAVPEVAGEQASSSTIEHLVLMLDQRDKLEVLAELADGPSPKLVFVRTRSFAEDVADLLDDHGMDAVALHGDLTQPRRTRNLERFSRGRATALVATDVAARGIHIDDVALVIQADAPDEYKTYLHRSGRTGRAGKDGVVVTLVAKNRRRRVEELLGRAGIQAEWTTVRPGDGTIRDLVERVNAQG